MTTRRFGKRLAVAASVAMAWAAFPAHGQQADPQQADAQPKTAKPIKAGDVLSGELNAMRQRGGKKGKRVATYQVTSEPRRLPQPGGLCNLETGPETFQLVTNSEAQAAQLKSLAGKQVSIRVDEVACAQEAGQMSEAIVTKWSVVK